MTELQKNQIIKMRKNGKGYQSIAASLNLSRDTVKNFCKKRNIAGLGAVFVLNDKEKFNEYKRCLNCYKQIRQPKHGRPKKFCSENCRREWWKQHPDDINKKETAQYSLKCDCCGKNFISYGNKNRKFCSYKCYIQKRFYGSEEKS